MIILDTSGLIANYDRGDRYHREISRIVSETDRRILSPFVLAELDYLISKLAGQRSEVVMLRDVSTGAYDLERFTATDIESMIETINRYADLRLGLADASIVMLAEKYRCRDILTLDQRHFRAVSGPDGKPFRLLPFDL